MKKFVPAALAAMLLLGANAAHAQISFGPKVGFGASNLNYSYSGSDSDTKENIKELNDKQGGVIVPSLGVMLNARFGKLALQPAVSFTQHGTKYKFEFLGVTQDYTVRLSYIDVPINLVYTLDNGFQIFAGPTFDFGIGGKTKVVTSGSGTDDGTKTHDVKFASKESDDPDDDKSYFRNPNIGANVGLGYRIEELQIQAGYNFGISNLEPNDANDKSTDITLRSNALVVTVGYFLGGK